MTLSGTPNEFDDFPADAIVVLGGGVNDDGTLPLVAQARVRRAVGLYHAGIAPRLILSGRCGLTASRPPVTEARAMADHARELGVDEGALLLEEESKDTLGNAYFTRLRHLEPNGWRSIRVVTSDYHLSRAAWVFQKILGGGYDFSFVAAGSGFTPRELIDRALEECKIMIFMNEWLQALEDADDHAIERLMAQEHPGYADAPTLSHDELRRRLDEIARINRIAGSDHWIDADPTPVEWDGNVDRRRRADRRAQRPLTLGRR